MIYVFDLDGTLIDSSLRHGILINRILLEEGMEADDAFMNKYMENKRNGMNSKMTLQAEYGLDEKTADRLVSKWIDGIESDELLLNDKLYFDSIETLEKLKNRQKRISFLSLRNRKDAAIKELKRLGIFDYATDIFIGNTNLGKQYKANKLKELRHREEVIMIGDTEIDYEASRMAGVKSYILDRGFRSMDYFKLYGIQTHSNFLNIFEVVC